MGPRLGWWTMIKIWPITPQKTNMSPIKRDYFNRKYIWTNHDFSGDILVFRWVYQSKIFLGGRFFSAKEVPRFGSINTTSLVASQPGLHRCLGWILDGLIRLMELLRRNKNLVNNGINYQHYQPQLVSLPDFWLPSTVWWTFWQKGQNFLLLFVIDFLIGGWWWLMGEIIFPKLEWIEFIAPVVDLVWTHGHHSWRTQQRWEQGKIHMNCPRLLELTILRCL